MSENMDNLHAALLLHQHNEWRRGNDNYDMANPKELGIAIDLAVAALRTPDTTALLKRALEALEMLLEDGALPYWQQTGRGTGEAEDCVTAIKQHFEGK